MKKIVVSLIAAAFVIAGCTNAREEANSEPEAPPRTLVDRETPPQTAAPRTTAPPVTISNDELFDEISSTILPGTSFQERQTLAYDTCDLIDSYGGDFYSLFSEAAYLMTIDPTTPAGMAEAFGGMVGVSVPYACPEWQPTLEAFLNANL